MTRLDFQLSVISIIFYFCIQRTFTEKNETVDTPAFAKAHAKVCDDARITLFEIRRPFDADKWTYCEIMLGSITFAPMHSLANPNTTNLTPIRFPYLREVYGYILLGYSSLRSFSSMFPRLSVIHGRDLYHGYSLIVMDNFLLDELGLTSLINVRRGNVIIARNAQLCYAKSLRWNEIMETPTSDVASRQNRENCAFCPTCPTGCWSPAECQKRCSSQCKGNCYSETVCCPSECVGGCYYNNNNNATVSSDLICNACRNMRIYATGKCVQQCPQGMLKTGGSLCVTPQECRSFFLGSGYILEEINECVASCPSGFTHGTGSRCNRCLSTPENSYCGGACREKHIRSLADFQSLRFCSRVHTLNIYNIATVDSQRNNFIEAFSAFNSLEQIDHEFTVHNVKVFSSLSMFSRLHHIGITSNATITIEENEFLTELWPLSQPPPILLGSLNIVRNARLCPKHILDYIDYTTAYETDLQVTNNTKNEYANGYLASCESDFLKISIDKDKIRSLTARINVAVPKELFFRSSGKAEHLRRPFLSIYYKPTRTRNETHFDVAQSHKWLRLVEKVDYNLASRGLFTMSVDLKGLLGDEWYAVYASITSNVNTVGLFSPIAYFRTLQRQPESIHDLRADALSSSAIQLMWEAPSKPNGPIGIYLIYYAPIEDRLPADDLKILCLMKNHWLSDVNVPRSDLNVTKSTRCFRPKSRGSGSLTGETDEETQQNQGIDQVVTDLSILEYQLINSVSPRKDPLVIRPEIKETIISDLDIYFQDKSSAVNEQSKSDSQENPVVEHKPFINDYNQTIPDTKVIIEGLDEAQLYMFQVYACHNISTQLSETCSLSGITITSRTKASDPSHDIVRNVQLIPPIEDLNRLKTNIKSLNYQISWLKPYKPNGLIYFYFIYVGQESSNGPKEERCVSRETYAVNVTLLPKTTYRLRIIAYTVSRLNNEYGDKQLINDEQISTNSSNLFFELVFITKDVPNHGLPQQNRLILFIFVTGSILLLLIIIIGAPFYYYKYGRGDTKASISKNPNYELYTPDQWEIDKDAVTLDRPIGQGHFGQVFQGVLKLPDGSLTPCAVKLRTTHPTDLLQEASIMKQFQCHHVIQLYGICSRIRPPYVVMELMENGDLKNYLYRQRQSDTNPHGPSLTDAAMIQIALDVADGMYYLSEQRFVHRDLAARNCLVNGNHICKVGDFGLTRDIYETDYYRRGGRSFLPIRWMAPESLRDGRFDTVSDVWSFGVLLWEIATLAEQPYQGYGNEEVIHYIRHGNITLERPMNCPEILHKLMRACWTLSPGDRISFRSIVDELVPYENEDFRLHAFYHTQPNQNQQTVVNDGHNDDDEEKLLLADDDDDDDDSKHH